MKKKTVQDVHIMERMPEKGGCRKVLTKHSAGSIKANVAKDRFFIMVSLFKEQCGKDEKPGWKKDEKPTGEKIIQMVFQKRISTTKRTRKKEVKAPTEK